nr:hypothetical protein [Tanacetum cinerariifolium]
AAGFGPEGIVGLVAVGREDIGQNKEQAVILASNVADGTTHASRAHGLHGVAAGGVD